MSRWRKRRALRRYERDRAWPLDDVTDGMGRINGQGREPIARMPYGISRVGFSGCESIAVYNLLRDMGREVTLPEVIRAADENRCFTLFGLTGIFPRGVMRLLKVFGLRFAEVSREERQRLGEGDGLSGRRRYIAIVQRTIRLGKRSLPNPFGTIHTFLLVWDEEGTRIGGKLGTVHWTAYNRYNSSRRGRVYGDIGAVLDDRARYLQLLEIEDSGA